jgi:hypothetical protein
MLNRMWRLLPVGTSPLSYVARFPCSGTLGRSSDEIIIILMGMMTDTSASAPMAIHALTILSPIVFGFGAVPYKG